MLTTSTYPQPEPISFTATLTCETVQTGEGDVTVWAWKGSPGDPLLVSDADRKAWQEAGGQPPTCPFDLQYSHTEPDGFHVYYRLDAPAIGRNDDDRNA